MADQRSDYCYCLWAVKIGGSISEKKHWNDVDSIFISGFGFNDIFISREPLSWMCPNCHVITKAEMATLTVLNFVFSFRETFFLIENGSVVLKGLSKNK